MGKMKEWDARFKGGLKIKAKPGDTIMVNKLKLQIRECTNSYVVIGFIGDKDLYQIEHEKTKA